MGTRSAMGPYLGADMITASNLDHIQREGFTIIDPIDNFYNIEDSARDSALLPFSSSDLRDHASPRTVCLPPEVERRNHRHTADGRTDGMEAQNIPQKSADLADGQVRTGSSTGSSSQMWPSFKYVQGKDNIFNVWQSRSYPPEIEIADLWPRRASNSSMAPRWYADHLRVGRCDSDTDPCYGLNIHGSEGSTDAPLLSSVVSDRLPLKRRSYPAASANASANASASTHQNARSYYRPEQSAVYQQRQLHNIVPDGISTNSTMLSGLPSHMIPPWHYHKGQLCSDTTAKDPPRSSHEEASWVAIAPASPQISIVHSTGVAHRQALYQRTRNTQAHGAVIQAEDRLKDQHKQLLRRNSTASSTSPAVPGKTFKPMKMVYRESHRRASASSCSTGTSSSVSTTVSDEQSGAYLPLATMAPISFLPPSQPQQYSPPIPFPTTFQASSPPASSPPTSTAAAFLSPDEQSFRRQQGISLNYRGDIYNPHNRSDHVPAHVNTSLFLMGLPPRASVADMLRAIAALGPTGRIFAASVNPPDPARRLPLAAAKISFFTRPQAERLKSLVDERQLVMYDTSTGNAYTVRCSWNRDRKPPRQCVHASECRVLRIRGPREVVNFAVLSAYFEEKFRYELQDVQIVASSGGDQTMEWRFASFQSQAIAAKMALNQECKMVRVEYGRDPCEWGEH